MFIGIVSHKELNIKPEIGYYPVFVGENAKNLKNMFDANSAYSDNTGKNISEKNPFFSELTALYWMAKNIENADYKGLVHYRRYFVDRNNEFISSKKIESILNEVDIILPQKVYSRQSVFDTYKRKHNVEDLNIIKHIIDTKYPGYSSSFDKVMNRHSYHSLNMIITKKAIFDNYSEWLFNILFESEKYVQISSDTYQRRVFGFLSERLLDVWIEKNNYSVNELKVINTEQTNKDRLFQSSKEKIYKILFNE